MPSLPGLVLLQASREGESYRARVRLEPESPLLRGHFPGHPILPGIAQLGLALGGARELVGGEASLVSLRGVRFRRPVRPGDAIELVVTRSAAPGSVCTATAFSRGREPPPTTCGWRRPRSSGWR